MNPNAHIRKGLFILALLSFTLSSFSTTLDSLENRIGQLLEVDQKSELIETYLALGMEYYYAGELNEAINQSVKAINQLNNQLPPDLHGRAFLHLANYQIETNQYTNALKNLHHSYELYSKAEQKDKQAIVLGNIAVVFEKLNNTELALEYNLRSLNLKRELGDSTTLTASYTNIGNIYMDMRKYEMSMRYYQKALELDSLNQDLRSISADYNNIGYLYSKLHDYRQSLHYYNKTLEIDQQLNDIYGQCIASGNIATSLYNLGDLKKAEEMAFASLDLAKQAGTIKYISENYDLLSKIAVSRGDQEQAYHYLKEHSRYKDSIYEQERAQEIAQIQRVMESGPNENQMNAYEENAEMDWQNFILFGLTILLFSFVAFLLILWISKLK
ncbi:tetratricopeptide repeat protein [bacterium SCSIO 12741]|nr:tetratricopeptide repeat protein [bacterium SCSIO 12741]